MKMRYKLLLFVIILGWALNLNAQSYTGFDSPRWAKQIPTPKEGKNFYYRVTISEGKTYDDAYATAYAMAIYESYSKLLGIDVKINSDLESIKDGVSHVITTNPDTMRLPINKVCVKIYQTHKRVEKPILLYVLWQVASTTLEDVIFENYKVS